MLNENRTLVATSGAPLRAILPRANHSKWPNPETIEREPFSVRQHRNRRSGGEGCMAYNPKPNKPLDGGVPSYSFMGIEGTVVQHVDAIA